MRYAVRALRKTPAFTSARLLVDDNDGSPRPVEIVGVVGNVRQATLDGEPTWDLYLTYPQIHPDNVGAAATNMFWIVRTEGDPLTLAPAIVCPTRSVSVTVVTLRRVMFDGPTARHLAKGRRGPETAATRAVTPPSRKPSASERSWPS